MFEHKHNWNYMYTSGADWDWFFCKECLAECTQKINVNTGTIEKYTYEHKKLKARK